MSEERLGNMQPLEFIKWLEAELKLDYDYYMTKLEDTPSANSAFDYLNGYTDYCEETGGILERYLREFNERLL